MPDTQHCPVVSLVVLNWNGADLLEQCIPSLLQTAYSNYEVVVVDNGSVDRSLEVLRRYPQVRVIALDANLGFAAAYNKAVVSLRCEFFATLNNDIAVDPAWLTNALVGFTVGEKVAIVGCRQMCYHDPDTIDCLYLQPTHHLLFRQAGARMRYQPGRTCPARGFVIGPGGASAIYRRSAFIDLGGFDERYESYQEESDLCLRAFMKGWDCVFIADAVVYHMGSATFNRDRRWFFYYYERNRIWFYYKNFPLLVSIRSLPCIIWRELRLFINVVFLNGHIRTYLRAVGDGLRGLRHFREDHRIQAAQFSNREKRYWRLVKRGILPLSEQGD